MNRRNVVCVNPAGHMWSTYHKMFVEEIVAEEEENFLTVKEVALIDNDLIDHFYKNLGEVSILILHKSIPAHHVKIAERYHDNVNVLVDTFNSTELI